jgi:hypothetical protein
MTVIFGGTETGDTGNETQINNMLVVNQTPMIIGETEHRGNKSMCRAAKLCLSEQDNREAWVVIQ